LKKLQEREYDLWYQSNLDASSKHQFGHMDRADIYALHLVSVVPENATTAQRKKLLSNCIYAVAFACLGSTSYPKPTRGSTIQSSRDVYERLHA